MKIVFKELLMVVLLAAFGGLINTLACKPKTEPYSWKRAVPEIFIAIFAGLLTHWLLKEWGVSDNLRTAGVALAGYSARGVLNVFNKIFLEKLKSFKFLWLFFAMLLLLVGGCQIFTQENAKKALPLVEKAAGVALDKAVEKDRLTQTNREDIINAYKKFKAARDTDSVNTDQRLQN